MTGAYYLPGGQYVEPSDLVDYTTSRPPTIPLPRFEAPAVQGFGEDSIPQIALGKDEVIVTVWRTPGASF